jgi:hypothetical protein
VQLPKSEATFQSLYRRTRTIPFHPVIPPQHLRPGNDQEDSRFSEASGERTVTENNWRNCARIPHAPRAAGGHDPGRKIPLTLPTWGFAP